MSTLVAKGARLIIDGADYVDVADDLWPERLAMYELLHGDGVAPPLGLMGPDVGCDVIRGGAAGPPIHRRGRFKRNARKAKRGRK